MTVQEVHPDQRASLFPGIAPERIEIALALADGAGGVAVVDDAFDSHALGLRIGRFGGLAATSPAAYQAVLAAVGERAAEAGYAQLLHRVPASSPHEVVALERAGYELLDIGLTFGQRPSQATLPGDSGFIVRPSTDDDMAAIVPVMTEQPWGGRYDTDPAYAPDRVRALRERWLWNCHRGRAEVVLVADVDGEPAGYVACLLDADARTGDIDLVGTVPKYRKRGVAAHLLAHALRWYSPRADMVTVRTHATNLAAARTYERAGFLLYHADLTFRLPVSRRPGGHE